MKNRMYNIFEFLRLIDAHDGLLSLTNVALIVVIVKLGFAQNASVVDLGTLFVALLSYSAKKYMNRLPDANEPPELEFIKEELKKNQSKVDALILKAGITR